MKIKVKHYFAGEDTTTWSAATGLCPARTCSHKHRTEAAAEACSAAHYPWNVYAELDDGRVLKACDVWRLEATTKGGA